jgi:DnaJ-class molecular chaperone
MAKQDFYELLGISRNASDQEIKTAYRKQALQWHPDRNKSPEATAKFKEITHAYEILSNKEKRAAYDQFGHAAFEQGGFGGGANPFGGGQTYRQGPFTYSYSTGGPGGGFENMGFGGFADPFEIFEQFFGGASPFGQRQPQKPVYSITISFMEAVHGVEKTVRVEGKEKKIKIPAGIDTQTRIRFDDFDLLITVTPDKRFERDGQDIFVTHHISFPEAAMGAVTKIPTLQDPIEIRIKPGTQPGTVIRLRGKGIPSLRGSGYGDLYIRLMIDVPEKLSRQAKDLLQQLQRELRS